MKREIILTEDGSSTIFLPEWHECYHSTHGAVNESNHIFIEAGLKHVLSMFSSIRILEVGLGTGLNAFLTAMNTTEPHHTIYYMGIEPFPISDEESVALHYAESSGFSAHDDCFRKIHAAGWDKESQILPHFTLRKTLGRIEDVLLEDDSFHLVYFDAFAPMVQPELWQKNIFEKLGRAMKPGGILVTYSCKGDVKRALKESGFTIEKLPGPIGKREFIRATKAI